VLLSTLSDLVEEARLEVLKATQDDDYANAVTTYLGLCASKSAAFHCSLARWRPGEGKSAPAFGRQAIAMVWDYAELNPFAGAGGDWEGVVAGAASVLERAPASGVGIVEQVDATTTTRSAVYVTDPPYYDNIGYADLSDFFYLWLRRSLKKIHPSLFSTLLVPKQQELVATPYRFGGDRRAADEHFEAGLGVVFERAQRLQTSGYPMCVIYAFRQTEETDATAGPVSTGWETMLEGLLRAGLSILGTWPMRTEGATRLLASGTNALASSIALVCRPRSKTAVLATRKDFLAALKAELPDALRHLQQGSIAPVDLAQATIGPGMGVFSRYSTVVEADGSSMPVRTALGLINHVLDETLAEQEADFDADTRWAVAWFEQSGMNPGPFGVAETLSKAKNTAINGLVAAGILESNAGKVRLLDRSELADIWEPTADTRLTVWEVAQHLIRALESGGEKEAAALLRKVGGPGETARELVYRLYVICERKKWAKEALAYNGLVISWPEISRLASTAPPSRGPEQQELL
jgi:putative DNA methylase